MNKESIKVSEKGALARHIESVVATHPKQQLMNDMLTGMVVEFAVSGKGTYQDIEWMNQVRIVTLN